MHLIISIIVIFELVFCIIAASNSHQNYARASCVTVTSSFYNNYSEFFFVVILSFHDNQNDFSLSDEFSDSDENQCKLIEQKIFETLSNASFLTNISKNNFISLQLIAFNELFEVVYIIKRFFNLTNSIKKYEIIDNNK